MKPSHIRAVAISLGLIAAPALVGAQTPPAAKATPQKAAKPEKAAPKPARERPDPLASQRRATAMTLATNLAEESRSFRDEQLRARVQLRAADALWEADADQARALFRRAWESADSADREAFRLYEEKRRQESKSGAWAGSGPPNLRGEVLRLAARRDRALGEEFLAKLSEARDQENQSLTIKAENAPAQPTPDPEKPPFAVAQRLLLAREFLEEGDIERALQAADKALDIVTTRGINFLSMLREKDQAAADKRFAAMFQRAALDPSSDATSVSVLSSYAFTPFMTLVVRGNGSNHTSQERDNITAPNISPELRAAFLRAGAQILLRPVPTPDQDRTLAGRGGLYFTIARLLPLYDQYAPDFSPELRAQMGALAPDAPERFRSGTDKMLTRGLVPEEAQRDEGQEALENADRAATPADRDLSFARAAMVAARKGDITARELVDKIKDNEMRKSARAFVDFSLISRAIERKDAEVALRLTRTGDELTSLQRVWALTEISLLVKNTDTKGAGEILEEAAMEARRIGGTEADRPRALLGVATRMYEVDRTRAWEFMSEVVKAGNSAADFTGADAHIVSRFRTSRGTSTSSSNVESFDLKNIFGLLAREDLFRAVELAKSFTNEAPRATATLAIIRAVLDNRQRETRVESRDVTNE
jgi:hypothetical protein